MRTILTSPDPEHPPDADILETATLEVDGVQLRFDLVEVPDPEPDFDRAEFAWSVLVRVRAFSLNYRDRALVTDPALRIRVAGGLGSEIAGEIVAAGPQAVLNAGDRVMANMAYPKPSAAGLHAGVLSNSSSEELAVFDSRSLIKIPDSMDDVTASAFVVGAQTATALVRRSELKSRELVLVTGATSNTSRFVLSLLGHLDVSVFAFTRRDGSAVTLGLPDGTRLLNVDESSKLERLVQSQRFGGFDAMIDPFADVYLPWSGQLLKMHGRYITCGMAGPNSEYLRYDRPAWGELIAMMVFKNLTVRGNCLGTSEDLVSAIDAWENKRLNVPIDSVHSSGHLARFLARSHAFDRLGKVVFKYSETGATAN